MELNDKTAAEIMEATSRAKGAVARILHGQEHAVEDVLQNARLKIVLRYATFEGRAKFSTWAYTITVREALMYVRGRRYEFIEFEEVNHPSHELSPERLARNSQLRKTLAANIRALSPMRRQAALRLFLGHEAADRTRKARLHSARVVLREALEGVRREF